MDPSSALYREIEQLLARNRWFSELPDRLQEKILIRSVVRRCAKGKVISTEGCPSPGLMLALEGQVGCTQWVGDEDEVLLHVGEPGFWFGVLSLLLSTDAVMNYVAQSEVRILLLPAVEFERIVAEDPSSYRHFARLDLERYAMLLRLVAEDRTLSPEPRLRAKLADMADARLRDRGEENPVELMISQSDLAALVGLSRQTVNEVLQRLAQQGLVELGFRKLVILRPDELRADLHMPASELDAI